jgi:phosphate starvation-inducible PhoH-like protein
LKAGCETYQKYLERGTSRSRAGVHARPDAGRFVYHTGRRAQNTPGRDEDFLTRLGFGSKIVITGDITQIDLPAEKISGLKEAMRVLEGVEDVAQCRLTGADVVRHVLVQRIISAYERFEKNRPEKPAVPNASAPRRRKNPSERHKKDVRSTCLYRTKAGHCLLRRLYPGGA